MVTIMTLLTAASMLLVVYHHAAWPLLLRVMTRGRRAVPTVPPSDRDLPCDAAAPPSVAVLVPAFDEAAVIGEKIRNLAALDYPPERLRVVVACDGCTDDTAARARTAAAELSCRHLRVEVREFATNRGKLAILNEVIPTLDADLVAMTDASALISVDALKIAAEHFADASIGVVCATYRLLEPGSPGEAAYWNYQLRLKDGEAALGAPLGAHGAFYLFRRRNFSPLPPDTINDDFVLPMSIVLAGCRAVYEPRMVAVELERATPWQDRRRRQRIAAGNLQQALRLRRLLRPRHRGIALSFASGKALRAIMPFLLVASLGGSLVLAPSSALFAAAAAGQVVLYGLALLRHMTPEVPWPRPIESIHYLVSGHIAGLIGATRYLLGAEGRGWSGAAHKRASGHAAIGVPRLGLWRLHCLPHVHPVVAVAKRAGDVAAAAFILLFVAPLFPLIALAIRLDSPGPVFFRQLRVGESLPDRTRLFQIIKFRTMRTDGAPVPKAKWASDNDPRITRVGRLLRKTRLDELPQLINVLRGEMSLVGPRPEQPGILPWLEANIPYYGERLYGVRPGITGFAQVYQGYDHTLDDVRAKLNYDHAYAMALSRPSAWLALELHIIGRTLRVMATAAGH